MKKYLFGLFALVLAIGFSAFTKPAKSFDDMYLFRLNVSPDITSSGVVTDPTKWDFVEIRTSGIECTTQENYKACEVLIHEDDVDLTSTPEIETGVLQEQNPSGFYSVSSSFNGNGANQAFNKADL